MTSISARNVTPREGFANLNKLGIYFTLHLNDEGNLFYPLILWCYITFTNCWLPMWVDVQFLSNIWYCSFLCQAVYKTTWHFFIYSQYWRCIRFVRCSHTTAYQVELMTITPVEPDETDIIHVNIYHRMKESRVWI